MNRWWCASRALKVWRGVGVMSAEQFPAVNGWCHCVCLTMCLIWISSFLILPKPPYICCCCCWKRLFGAWFHVIPMNVNGNDRAVTMGWLRKQASLCSWPRLCCCQDLSRQLQFTILPQPHETGARCGGPLLSLSPWLMQWQKVQLVSRQWEHFGMSPDCQKTPPGGILQSEFPVELKRSSTWLWAL